MIIAARVGAAALFVNIDRRSGTRLTELARRARVTKQAMMLLVDELEQKVYVRRVPDADDARAKVVRLTARGRRATAETRRVVQAEEQYVRRLIGDRHTDTLQEALEWLVTASRETEEEEEEEA